MPSAIKTDLRSRLRPQKRTPSNLRTWGLEVCCLNQASSAGRRVSGDGGAAQHGLIRPAPSNAPSLFQCGNCPRGAPEDAARLLTQASRGPAGRRNKTALGEGAATLRNERGRRPGSGGASADLLIADHEASCIVEVTNDDVSLQGQRGSNLNSGIGAYAA